MRSPCLHCPILIITAASGQMLIFSFYSWGNSFREMRWSVPGHIANKWQLLAWDMDAGIQSPRLWFLHWRSIWPLPPRGPPLPSLYLWRTSHSAPTSGVQLYLNSRCLCSNSPGSDSARQEEAGRGGEATLSQGRFYILIRKNSDKLGESSPSHNCPPSLWPSTGPSSAQTAPLLSVLWWLHFPLMA